MNSIFVNEKKNIFIYSLNESAFNPSHNRVARRKAPLTCPHGFEYDFKRKRCSDIDECLSEDPTKGYGDEVCSYHEVCVNYRGSYKCFERVKQTEVKSYSKFSESEKRSSNIYPYPQGPLECTLCGHQCNFPDLKSDVLFSCSCFEGYQLARDGYTCLKIKRRERTQFNHCDGLPGLTNDREIARTIKFNNKCFIYSGESTKVNYDQAKNICQKRGWKLSQISDKETLFTLERMAYFEPFWIETIDPKFYQIYVNNRFDTSKKAATFFDSAIGKSYSSRVTSIEDIDNLNNRAYINNLSGFADMMPRQVDIVRRNLMKAVFFCEAEL